MKEKINKINKYRRKKKKIEESNLEEIRVYIGRKEF